MVHAPEPTSLYVCPTTGYRYPETVRRVVRGGVVWVLCPFCNAGDGSPQPHPCPPKEADREPRQA